MIRLHCYRDFYEISDWLIKQCYFVRRDMFMYTMPVAIGLPERPVGYFDFESEEQAMMTLLRFGESLKVGQKESDPLTVEYK